MSVRLRDPRLLGVSNTGRRWGRHLALLLLLVTLALAPALDLAGDAGAASLTDAPVKTLDLCTVAGVTPPPPILPPVMAISCVPETATISAAAAPARALDHPPRPA